MEIAQLVSEMLKIHNNGKYNKCYGRERMYMSLLNKKKAGDINIHIPCEGTIRNVTDKIGLIHKPHRKPNRITKADRESQKTDDLPKRV